MDGIIHSIETLSAVDGPHIRSVVFLSGCPLRCKYCHNPDMWTAKSGQIYSAEQLFQRLKRYKNYFKNGGGVTFSGGEPLMQSKFLIELIKKLKTENINVAIETGGGVFDEDAKQALKLADLVIFDLKHTDQQGYKNICAGKMEVAQSLLDFLRQQNIAFWVRYVVVPSLTDDIESIKKLKQMAAGAQKIELLAYHTLGLFKYEKLGIPYPLKNIEPPDQGTMQRLRQSLEKY